MASVLVPARQTTTCTARVGSKFRGKLLTKCACGHARATSRRRFDAAMLSWDNMLSSMGDKGVPASQGPQAAI